MKTKTKTKTEATMQPVFIY